GIHFLRHNIRLFSDPSNEQLCRFEDRSANLAEPIQVKCLAQAVLEGVPNSNLGRKNIVRAADSANHALLRFHSQVRFLVLMIPAGVFIDACGFLIRYWTFYSSRHSQDQTARGNLCTFRDEGPSANNRILTHHNVVQQRGTHSDKAVRLDEATV